MTRRAFITPISLRRSTGIRIMKCFMLMIAATLLLAFGCSKDEPLPVPTPPKPSPDDPSGPGGMSGEGGEGAVGGMGAIPSPGVVVPCLQSNLPEARNEWAKTPRPLLCSRR